MPSAHKTIHQPMVNKQYKHQHPNHQNTNPQNTPKLFMNPPTKASPFPPKPMPFNQSQCIIQPSPSA